MKNHYRFSFFHHNVEKVFSDQIRDLQISVEEKGSMGVFEFDDTHPNSAQALALAEGYNLFSSVTTTFDANELENASWLWLRANWINGYPEPQGGKKNYAEVSFSRENACPKCRIGEAQTAAIRLRGEPKWGTRRWLMELYWLPAKLFVKRSVWEQEFAPMGVGCRPVANKRDEELESVVQLDVAEQVDLDLNHPKITPTLCPVCGEYKYDTQPGGFLPGPRQDPGAHAFSSTQTFGQGGQTYHPILISQALYSRLKKLHPKSAQFYPAAEPSCNDKQ